MVKDFEIVFIRKSIKIVFTRLFSNVGKFFVIETVETWRLVAQYKSFKFLFRIGILRMREVASEFQADLLLDESSRRIFSKIGLSKDRFFIIFHTFVSRFI